MPDIPCRLVGHASPHGELLPLNYPRIHAGESPPPHGPCSPMEDNQPSALPPVATCSESAASDSPTCDPTRVTCDVATRARRDSRSKRHGCALKSQASHGGSVNVHACAGLANLFLDSLPRAAGEAGGPAQVERCRLHRKKLMEPEATRSHAA